MSRFKHEEPARFDWPEPLVIEIAAERYQDVADEAARTAIARLQAATLRERFAGRSRQAAALRLELAAACAARGIAAERLPRTDLAVRHELTRLAAVRFRMSPRLSAEIHARLEATLTPRNDGPASPARSTAVPFGSHGLRAVAASG